MSHIRSSYGIWLSLFSGLQMLKGKNWICYVDSLKHPRGKKSPLTCTVSSIFKEFTLFPGFNCSEHFNLTHLEHPPVGGSLKEEVRWAPDLRRKRFREIQSTSQTLLLGTESGLCRSYVRMWSYIRGLVRKRVTHSQNTVGGAQPGGTSWEPSAAAPFTLCSA